MTYRLTPKAEEDLEGILKYSRDKWGVSHASRYRDRLLACCMLCGTEQWSGKPTDLRPGLRRIQEGRHMVLFQRDGGDAIIVRILHASRRLSLHVVPDDEEEL